MSTDIVEKNGDAAGGQEKEMPAALLEKVLLGGDLGALSPQDRMVYLQRLCASLGLNPLTRPFEYLKLQGRLTLYTRRDATDQLRTLRGISITRVDVAYEEDVVIVTVSAQDARGRTDTDIGAVSISGLRGEARANAIMKAITKAKRRCTLSICGLGFLDETEVDSIPGAERVATEELAPSASAGVGLTAERSGERPTEEMRRAALEGRSLVAARPEQGQERPVDPREHGARTQGAAQGPAALPTDNAGLMRAIEQASGLSIAGMRQWNDLARTYGARELGTKADLTRAWMVDVLGRINAAKARDAEQYRTRILGATTPEEVSDALAEAFKAHQRGTLSSESAEELADLADARDEELRRDLAAHENESAAQANQDHLAQAAS